MSFNSYHKKLSGLVTSPQRWEGAANRLFQSHGSVPHVTGFRRTDSGSYITEYTLVYAEKRCVEPIEAEIEFPHRTDLVGDRFRAKRELLKRF